jgi:Ca2+-binding EF-hand superfamily protein
MMDPQWIRQDRYNAEPGGKLKEDPIQRSGTGRGESRIEAAFTRADRNGDGKLTRDEFPQPRVFDRVDANGDGTASLEEVRQFYSQRNRNVRRNP